MKDHLHKGAQGTVWAMLELYVQYDKYFKEWDRSGSGSGSGAMVIALALELKEQGVNYQPQLHVTAVDVDAKCVHMTYLQLALTHIPAVVVHGNSLNLEEYGRWYTPAHIMNGWNYRLRRGTPTAEAHPEPTQPESVSDQPAEPERNRRRPGSLRN